MLLNYLKISWRNLRHRTFYAALNSIGLATGITFTLLIGSYIWGEWQMNRQLRNYPQQCLVQSRWKKANMGMDITSLPPFGPALTQKYPSLVANYYRFHGVNAIVSKGTKHFRESIQVGDPSLLTMYRFSLLHGNAQTAMDSPNNLVITAAKALKYFGRTDVLNELMTIETPLAGKQAFRVTGVLNALPRNSVSQLLPEDNEVFMPMSAFKFFANENAITSWQNPYIVVYVELQPGVTPDQLNKPLADLLAANAPAEIRDNLTAYVTPLTDYYLDSNNGLVWRMITTLGAVGLFILLMAVANFINLSLGGSSARLREIGVRKVLGGLRWQLIGQFLLEAITLTALATALSVGLFYLTRAWFGGMVGKAIPTIDEIPGAFIGLGGLIAVVGVLAGSYPAFYLSAYAATDSLKGKTRSVREGVLFRRALVTGQFGIAAFVFIGAMIISQQVRYFFDTDLGFQKNALLTVSSLPRNWSAEGVTRMQATRDQLARLPGIESVSLSFEIPNGNVGNSGNVYRKGQDSTRAISAQVMVTDNYYAQTYQLAMRAGDYFQQQKSNTDSSNIVLNESAVKALGYATAEAAVGQEVRFHNDPTQYRIGGVVRDFHVGSMHQTIQPTAMFHVQRLPIYRFYSFRLASANLPKTISTIEHKWHELFPDAPFDFAFMDQTLGKLYQTELRLEKAAYVATGLALLIVLLGVIGLVSLSVSRRTREVGIRKVLGASVPGIVGLFLKEYAWMLLLGNLLAWPLAYWGLSDWLAGYAYRTAIGWSPFLLVSVGLALLTGVVVAIQVVKIGLRDPVKSLRTE